ncbi:uroporphyrinogen-III C-methyltransferase [Vibrio sp. CDRSL-10 TSBA]
MTSKKDNPQQEPEQSSVPAADSSVQTSARDANDASTANAGSETAAAKPADSEASVTEKQAKRGVKLGTIAIVLAILFGGGLTLHSQQQQAQYQAQIKALQTELTQTRASIDQKLADAKQQAVEHANQVTHRAEVVLTQQQKTIESLQVAVADMKGRRPNDWLLAEADYLVKLAGRKLFLEHDVESATQLMESADQRIAALNDPSLTPLRKAMANDITKLKTIPLLDRDGLVLRLISLQQQVDHLPLANAILPQAAQQEQQTVSEDINNWQQNLMTSLKDFADNFITFRTRDGNVVPLLSPEQHFYLQENLKAKLETAIKAVYAENQEMYTTALSTAAQWSGSFFNLDDSQVTAFSGTLEQLGKQKVQVEYPVKLETQKQLSDVISERLRRSISSMTTEEK